MSESADPRSSWVHGVLAWVIRGLLALLCRVDHEQLAQVPNQGPLIVVVNHINFLEVPLIYTYLLPRRVIGLVKVESWSNPLIGPLVALSGAIPLHRGVVDRAALKQALRAVEAGHIVAVAPEGTRSGDGRLRKGRPGTVFLALESGAPILPIVHYGGEAFWDNLRRLRRTDFHLAVGEPFYVDCQGVQPDRRLRRRVTDEIMYQLAALLPPSYRGVYADLSSATERYLRFPEGASSNLSRAAD